MGNTMNVVVLFSLILVVGMLVDGAIVVTELADLSRGAVLDAASFSEDKDVSDVRPVHIVARAQGAKRWYLSQLYRMLIHPWITLLAVLLFTAGSYALYSKVGRGVEFFPSVEPVSMAISVAARDCRCAYRICCQ